MCAKLVPTRERHPGHIPPPNTDTYRCSVDPFPAAVAAAPVAPPPTAPLSGSAPGSASHSPIGEQSDPLRIRFLTGIR